MISVGLKTLHKALNRNAKRFIKVSDLLEILSILPGNFEVEEVTEVVVEMMREKIFIGIGEERI